VNLAAVLPLTDPDSPKPASETIRIVLVDDSSLLRDGIANLLAVQSDISVLGVADSPVSAVEELRKHRPDVVLLGWPASAPPSQRVFAAIQDGKLSARVIMLASDESKDDFVEAVKQGCCGVVSKKSSAELLLKSIRKVHAGEFWLDRATTADVIRRLAKRGGGSSGASSRLGVRDQSTALSNREREIVVLVAQGFKNKEIAERMFISEQTVKNHLHNIFDKLGVSDRLELALYAIHHNLHEPA